MQSGRDIPSLQKMVFSYMSQKGLLMVLLHSSQTASFFINVRITTRSKKAHCGGIAAELIGLFLVIQF